MNLHSPVAVLAFSVIASVPAQPAAQEPQPMVMVESINLPQIVPEEYLHPEASEIVVDDAVAVYHNLRKDFSISHTTMAEWLGIKRRTLYNWLNAPEKSLQYGPQIENRLSYLLKLRNEMEPEHYRLLHKVAFSPIYGNPEFGKSILEGASDTELLEWYDKLFSKFESYRNISRRKDSLA